MVAHGPDSSIFERLNDTLANLGVPTWNLGPYPVRPIVSAGFLLSVITMGFRGLLFSGVLFFLVNYSRPDGGFQMPDLSSFTGGAITNQQATNTSNIETGRRQRRQDSGAKTTAFSGRGYKLE